jgi:hypothetical protein
MLRVPPAEKEQDYVYSTHILQSGGKERNEAATSLSANSMRPRRAVAKRREPHAPTHAIHARLSIGIGASWRDHEQNGRCTKELL